MNKKIKLTYEQLYFLGELINADYIDYRYIKAMQDIEQRYEFIRNNVCAELVETGIVSENFMGEINVKPEIKELLEPVFFGREESEAEIVATGEHASISVQLFHIWNDKITYVAVKDNGVELEPVNTGKISDFVLTMCRDISKYAMAREFNENGISKVIKIKNAKIGIGCRMLMFAVSGDRLYRQNDDGDAELISVEQFRSIAENLLKGE